MWANGSSSPSETAVKAIVPLAILGIAAASWALRPGSRQMGQMSQMSQMRMPGARAGEAASAKRA